MLSVVVDKLIKMPISANKKAMILVQITGALRNLANIDSSHPEISRGIVRRLCEIFFDKNLN